MNENDVKKIRIKGVIFALLIYGVLIGVNFDPNVTKVQANITGEYPFGIPVRIFFIILNAILFFPIFFVSKHFIMIASHALKEGKSVKGLSLIKYLFSIGKNHPSDIQKSKSIVLKSLFYFIFLLIIWIVVSSLKGV